MEKYENGSYGNVTTKGKKGLGRLIRNQINNKMQELWGEAIKSTIPDKRQALINRFML